MPIFTVKHTSPNEITEILETVVFGDVLFFSHNEYVMSPGGTITYELDLDDDKVVTANSLFYRDDCALLDGIVSEVMGLAECDEDTAQELLSERKHASEFDTDDGELSWALQRLLGQVATAIGADAIEATDEQGTVYIVPMTGKLDRLRKAA